MKTRFINLNDTNDSYLGNVIVDFNIHGEVDRIFTDIDNPNRFQGFSDDEKICIIVGDSIFQQNRLLNLMKFFEKNRLELFREYEYVPKIAIVFLYEVINKFYDGSLWISNPIIKEVFDKAHRIDKVFNEKMFNYNIIEYGYLNADINKDYSICRIEDAVCDIPYDVRCMNPVRDMINDIMKNRIGEFEFDNQNHIIYLSPTVNNIANMRSSLDLNTDFYTMNSYKDIEFYHVTPFDIMSTEKKTINIYYVENTVDDIFKDVEFKNILGRYLLKEGITINLHIYMNIFSTWRIDLLNIDNTKIFESLSRNQKPIFTKGFCNYEVGEMMHRRVNFNCTFNLPDIHADNITNIIYDHALEYVPENISLYSTNLGKLLC